MTHPVDDGGAAFPQIERLDKSTQGFPHYQVRGVGGMSLRDWFAGQALQALIEYATLHQPGNAEVLAKLAYKHADAMLAAREAA